MNAGLLRLIWCLVALALGGVCAQAGLQILQKDANYQDSPRLALVIGAGEYEHLPDLNGANDARILAEALQGAKFATTLIVDEKVAAVRNEIDGFLKKVSQAGPNPVVLLYLTANGNSGRAYFGDENPKLSKDAGFEIKPLLERIATANENSLNILMVDTDYTHTPFTALEGENTRGATGLYPFADRTLVFVSAGRQSMAFDKSPTDPNHGPFALALAARLSEPGLRLRKFMQSVRIDVLLATNEQQDPQIFGSADPPFYFHEPTATAAQNPAYRAATVLYEDANGELKPTYEDGSFALLVGVSDYDDNLRAWADLPAVRSELEDLGRLLRDLHGFDVTYVHDPKGTELRTAIEAFVNEHGQKRNARLLIMLSGHGETATVNNKKLAWFVPRDAPRLSDGRGPFNSVALSMRRIEEWSETMEAKHVLWLFDSCFSGAALRMTGRKSSNTQAYSEFLHANAVRRVITAGSENEVVPAESRFARRLIAVLKGDQKVGNSDDLVTGDEIGQFLREDLIAFTRRQGLKPQTPQNDTIVIPDEEGDIVFQIEPSLLSSTSEGTSQP